MRVVVGGEGMRSSGLSLKGAVIVRSGHFFEANTMSFFHAAIWHEFWVQRKPITSPVAASLFWGAHPFLPPEQMQFQLLCFILFQHFFQNVDPRTDDCIDCLIAPVLH